MSDEIANLLRHIPLIEEIKKESSLSDFANSLVFKQFVKKGLAPLVNPLTDDHDLERLLALLSDPDLLKLLDDVKNEINKQITSEGEMITEGKALAVGTKIAIASGAFLLIGGAIAYYVYTQQEEQKKRDNQDSSMVGKAVGVVKKIAGQSEQSTAPVYHQHHLLLVVPANKLPVGLAIGQISNDKINNLIVNAVRVYCFASGDKNGEQVLNSVDCSDTPIDYTTENRVFVQLELSATSAITAQQNKLGIRQAVEPSSLGKVLQVKTLQSARSASESTGFYKI